MWSLLSNVGPIPGCRLLGARVSDSASPGPMWYWMDESLLAQQCQNVRFGRDCGTICAAGLSSSFIDAPVLPSLRIRVVNGLLRGLVTCDNEGHFIRSRHLRIPLRRVEVANLVEERTARSSRQSQSGYDCPGVVRDRPDSEKERHVAQ